MIVLRGILALGLAASILGSGAAPTGGAEPQGTTAADGERFFVGEVLPILQSSCYECHGPDVLKPKGGLRMVGREAFLRGGHGGPAIVAGDPEQSLLVQAIRYKDPFLQMPPPGKLTDAQIAVIERWIELGAPWPAPKETAPTGSAEAASPEAVRFFEERIRPVLAESCYECHGPERKKVKGGLRMSGRDALLRGGESGPEIVPGEPDESRLVRAVRYTERLKMPPDEKLGERAIADIERWVEMGAPWPSSGEAPSAADEPAGIDVEAGRTWWSFQPVRRPAVPDVAPARVKNPIDAFLLARLDQAGIAPNPRADERQLVRRVYFDLVGLPPSYAVVEAFAADARPRKWERLVDELLARPEYGERWGRHWLDLVRYAQTNGYERDTEKPFAWRYRDYVIDAFNADVPYDRFIREQLAGDELDQVAPASIVATGFYRLGPWDDEPDDPETAVYDEYDDVVRTIGEGFLGTTIACARCHDHKFDPFSQVDYYRTLAFVRNVRPYETPEFSLDSATLVPLASDAASIEGWEGERKAWIAERQGEIDAMLANSREGWLRARLAGESDLVRAAFGKPAEERTEAEIALVLGVGPLEPTLDELTAGFSQRERRRFDKLRNEIAQARESFEGSLAWTLAARESGPEPAETHLLVRGRPSTPGQAVEPAFVQVLCATDADMAPSLPAASPSESSTGRRRALAEWIASPSNPLTARVLVNRVWQFHFGRGIVATPNDFGRAGVPPTHPELLDWLASEFVARGWSLKRLHRLILTSNAYRMSSAAANPEALAADEANELFWRQSLHRLEAEAIRDAMLLAGGDLDPERGGRGFFPFVSRGALGGASRPGEGWESGAEPSRRSVYAYVKRSLPVPFLDVFDAPSTSLPVGTRPSTTTPAQTLTLTNGDFAGRAAERFARRVAAEAGDDPVRQVARAFEIALSRRPSPTEERRALVHLRDQAEAFAAVHPVIAFEPRVPRRLQVKYLQEIDPRELVYGPTEGWTYLKGEWGKPYNATKAMDEDRGPAALVSAIAFRDGVLQARVRLALGTDLGALLLRAEAIGDRASGLEVRLEPEPGEVALYWHDASAPSAHEAAPALPEAGGGNEAGPMGGPDAGEKGTRLLARAAAGIEPDRWHDVRVELAGPRVRVSIDGVQRIEVEEPAADRGGAFGARVLGERLELDQVSVLTGDGTLRVEPDPLAPPEQRALESLCLAIQNLNEFLYVD